MQIKSPTGGTVVGGVGICDIDPGANIIIRVIGDAGAGPDANGRNLHPVINFPVNQRTRTDDRMARMQRALSGWFDVSNVRQRSQVSVEADPGTYYFPYGCQIDFTGGVGSWLAFVDISVRSEPYQAQSTPYWLTTRVAGPAHAILAPDHHTVVRLVQGAIVYDGVNVITPGIALPLSAAAIAKPGTIYQTGGVL